MHRERERERNRYTSVYRERQYTIDRERYTYTRTKKDVKQQKLERGNEMDIEEKTNKERVTRKIELPKEREKTLIYRSYNEIDKGYSE